MSFERRELPYSWDELKARLQRDVLRLLPTLGIHAQERGGMVTPLNPTRNDRSPGSFVIWTTSGRDGAIGAWKDYATGEAGDVFDLIAYLLRLQGKMDAYWWALDFLGLGRGNVRTKAEADAERERVERERLAAEARKEKQEAARARALKAEWLAMKPWLGSPVQAYLILARSIPMGRLLAQPEAIRFEPAAEHHDDETGEVTVWPAMTTAITRGPDIVGLHRTYLRPDGGGKAPVRRAKKMFGPIRGGAMRLVRGASGLTPAQAEKKGVTGPLIIGEGIETVLSMACAVPEYRAWAPGSLSLMDGFDWPACASAIVLLRDNDWSEPQAVKRFETVEAHWRSQAKGRPVKVITSGAGSDFNDMLKAAP